MAERPIKTILSQLELNYQNSLASWSCQGMLRYPFVSPSLLSWITLRKYLRNGALQSYALCQYLAGFIPGNGALSGSLFSFALSFPFLLLIALICANFLYERVMAE